MTLARAVPTLAVVLLTMGCNSLAGSLASSGSRVGTWSFRPTRCTGNASTLVLSSRADPLRYVMLEREDAPGATSTEDGQPVAPSILAEQSGLPPPMRLTVLDLTSRTGAPVVIESRTCTRLSLSASPSFTTRINGGPWIVSYSGSADIDCDGHRLVGHFDFTCPEE